MKIFVLLGLFIALTASAQQKRTTAREGDKSLTVVQQINNLADDLTVYAKAQIKGTAMETRTGFHLGQYERRCNEIMAMVPLRADLNPSTSSISDACLNRPKDSATILSLVDKLKALANALAAQK